MYLVHVYDTNVKAHATRPAPTGPEFQDDVAATATSMELWGTSFDDPGPDFCEYRLFKGREQIGSKRFPGY